MAVVQTILKAEDLTGRKEVRGGKVVTVYTDVWKVLTDGPETRQPDVLADDAVPHVRDRHPRDTLARCGSVEASCVNNGARPVWEVRAEYSNEVKESESPIYPETPAEIEYTWDFKEVAIEKDLEDKPIQNTAGDPYDPPITIDAPIPVKSIQVNLSAATFTPAWLNQYFRAVNSDSYDGWGAKQAKVVDMSARSATYTDEDGIETDYWAVSIKIAFDAKGWQPEIMSRGFNERFGEDNETRRITLSDGSEASSPVPLDQTGHALFGDDVENAHFEKFKTFNEVSFADLDF